MTLIIVSLSLWAKTEVTTLDLVYIMLHYDLAILAHDVFCQVSLAHLYSSVCVNSSL